MLIFTENENNTTCTFPKTKEKLFIRAATIQLADCETEKASLETSITSNSAIKRRSTAFLAAPTLNNITENNGTHAGNIVTFPFTACNVLLADP